MVYPPTGEIVYNESSALAEEKIAASEYLQAMVGEKVGMKPKRYLSVTMWQKY